MMNFRIKLLGLSLLGLPIAALQAQNLLPIPDTLSGTTFHLSLLDTSHVFVPGYTTETFGVNGSYFGPTLFLNRGDSVSMEVENLLMDTTTIHWHGMHVSPMNDGGPHITIPPGTVWNPQFRIRDHAAMYWYHPHLHMMTNLHATLGAAGLIIVRDSEEAALPLPRRYGVDDFPLVIQSKAFDSAMQIQIMTAYDSVMMVNGAIDPYLPTPAQVVRFRLLNASSERVYNLGLDNGQAFFQIGSDGGLLDAPVSLTRLRLAPGERAEILVDFGGMEGQTVNLMSYSSEFVRAIYGALQPGMGSGQVLPGYTANPLNGADFQIMAFQVGAATANPVTSLPTALVTNTPWPMSALNATKTLTFTPLNTGSTAIQGPFLINGASFDMGVINYSIPLDHVELWTLTNNSPIAHPFHIHDVQFYLTSLNGAVPPANMAGRKDVVLVESMQTVQFITKFESFCDSMAPYMYHCHMLTHEDEGMMGQFLVTCPTAIGVEEGLASGAVAVYPNPSTGGFEVRGGPAGRVRVYDGMGRVVWNAEVEAGRFWVDLGGLAAGLYWLDIGEGTRGVRLVRE